MLIVHCNVYNMKATLLYLKPVWNSWKKIVFVISLTHVSWKNRRDDEENTRIQFGNAQRHIHVWNCFEVVLQVFVTFRFNSIRFDSFRFAYCKTNFFHKFADNISFVPWNTFLHFIMLLRHNPRLMYFDTLFKQANWNQCNVKLHPLLISKQSRKNLELEVLVKTVEASKSVKLSKTLFFHSFEIRSSSFVSNSNFTMQKTTKIG